MGDKKMPIGFVFGKLGNEYITKKEDMDGHILVVGGAGSGKTSCVAIPSLWAWRKRVFCIDIKGAT
jgi:type IV secretion system protein VirD4